METQFTTLKLETANALLIEALRQKVQKRGMTFEVFLRELLEEVDKGLKSKSVIKQSGTKKQRTWADVLAELDALPSDDFGPTDLSTNKKHMEGYGK